MCASLYFLKLPMLIYKRIKYRKILRLKKRKEKMDLKELQLEVEFVEFCLDIREHIGGHTQEEIEANIREDVREVM
jgi:hypothetical protein